jgi:hypothetical protein
MSNSFTEREQVVEVINRLFFYTDHRDWTNLTNEVFAEKVLLDMVSLGAKQAELLTPGQICKMWEDGFKGLDAIHHQAGNYIISITGESAEGKAYAIASHYKRNAAEGAIREFIGSYDFHLLKGENGWRIDKFRYNLKYMDGNADLK